MTEFVTLPCLDSLRRYDWARGSEHLVCPPCSQGGPKKKGRKGVQYQIITLNFKPLGKNAGMPSWLHKHSTVHSSSGVNNDLINQQNSYSYCRGTITCLIASWEGRRGSMRCPGHCPTLHLRNICHLVPHFMDYSPTLFFCRYLSAVLTGTDGLAGRVAHCKHSIIGIMQL